MKKIYVTVGAFLSIFVYSMEVQKKDGIVVDDRIARAQRRLAYLFNVNKCDESPQCIQKEEEDMKQAGLITSLLCTASLAAMDPSNAGVAVKTYEFSHKGRRSTDEDRKATKIIKHNDTTLYCTGIFDGHAGADVAQLASDMFFDFFEKHVQQSKSIEESLRNACAQCEELTKKEQYQCQGSTLLASCFEENSGKLTLLWLGDSAGYANGKLLTFHHDCMNYAEQKRIKRAGAKISKDKLNGLIAVTRSLGDANLKDRIPALSAEPDVITQCNAYNGGYYIGVSDGFWNALYRCKDDFETLLWNAKNLSHTDFYEKYPNNSGTTNRQERSEKDDELVSDSDEEHEVNIAQRLVYVALCNQGGKDNVTVIVQLFGSSLLLEVESSDSSEEGSASNTENISSNCDNVDAALKALNNLGAETSGSATKEKDSTHANETSSGSGCESDNDEDKENNKEVEFQTKAEACSEKETQLQQQVEQVRQIVEICQQKGDHSKPVSWKLVDAKKAQSRTGYSIWTSIHHYRYVIGGGVAVALAALVAWYCKQLPMSFVAG